MSLFQRIVLFLRKRIGTNSLLYRAGKAVRDGYRAYIQTFRVLILFLFKRNEFIFLKNTTFQRLPRRLGGGLYKGNWGDDLNHFFIEEATGKKVVAVPDSLFFEWFHVPYYILIGSTLSFFFMHNATVWGTGIINSNEKTVRSLPKRICSVRGPLTRQWLLERGIGCPSIYGDPALLLPRYYRPDIQKSGKIALVPNNCDLESDKITNLRDNPSVDYVKLKNYNDWHEIIDRIVAADIVVSSSLHGLIVAEAYGIPSIWGLIGPYPEGWEFKFLDFYASIGKQNPERIQITRNTTMDELRKVAMKWSKVTIDTDELVKACPFELK